MKGSLVLYIIKNILVLFFGVMIALSGWAQSHLEHGDLLDWSEMIEPEHFLSWLGPIAGVCLAFLLKQESKS